MTPLLHLQLVDSEHFVWERLMCLLAYNMLFISVVVRVKVLLGGVVSSPNALERRERSDNRLTFPELAHVHLANGFAGGNALLAQRLDRERFPAHHPSHRVCLFTRRIRPKLKIVVFPYWDLLTGIYGQGFLLSNYFSADPPFTLYFLPKLPVTPCILGFTA